LSPDTRSTQAEKDLRHLRRERQNRVEETLGTEMRQQAPGNAIYWLVVVLGAFLLNLLLLVLVAG
jgi:hypothetical protein